MGHRKQSAPRHGSLAFLPRKRAAQIKGRTKHWLDTSDKINFLGFAGFKAGMTHITYIEDQKNSPYYGKELMKPVTIIEMPPLILIGIRLYNKDDYGKYVIGELFTKEINDYLIRKVNIPNYELYNFDEKKAKEILHEKEVKIVVKLNKGVYSDRMWTCDFSYDYIKINASYRS